MERVSWQLRFRLWGEDQEVGVKWPPTWDLVITKFRENLSPEAED
jgi:hypothetical protein